MLKNDKIATDYFPIKSDIIFSFGKSNEINENTDDNNNKNFINNENIINNKKINDREGNDSKIEKCVFIYKLLNKNKNQQKENSLPLFNLNNITQANNITKPKIETNKNDCISPKKTLKQKSFYKILDYKEINSSKSTSK